MKNQKQLIPELWYSLCSPMHTVRFRRRVPCACLRERVYVFLNPPIRLDPPALLSYTRTTDTKRNLGRFDKQNILRPYLKMWNWELIFGRAVKSISSPDVRSPWSYTMQCSLPMFSNYLALAPYSPAWSYYSQGWRKFWKWGGGQNLLPDWDKVIWSAKVWAGVRSQPPGPAVPPVLFCRLLLCWPGIHIKNWAGVIKLGAGTCIPHYLLHCKYISSLILHCPNCSFSLCANSHLHIFWHSFVFKSSGNTMYSTD